MSAELKLPFFIHRDNKTELNNALDWAASNRLLVNLTTTKDLEGYRIDITTEEGVPLQRLIDRINVVVARYPNGVTLAVIRNHTTILARISEKRIKWLLNELCRVGVIERIDDVHKQSGRPLPRYKTPSA